MVVQRSAPSKMLAVAGTGAMILAGTAACFPSPPKPVACELPPGAVLVGGPVTGSVVDPKGPDFGENRWAGVAVKDGNKWSVTLAQYRQTGLGVEATRLDGRPLGNPKIAQPKGNPGIICYTYDLQKQELKEGIRVAPAGSGPAPANFGDPTSITLPGAAPHRPASLRSAVKTGGGKSGKIRY